MTVVLVLSATVLALVLERIVSMLTRLIQRTSGVSEERIEYGPNAKT
ncbi:MAG: hypothetical protein ACKO3T_15485 [Planctomycetaceae bacterium]